MDMNKKFQIFISSTYTDLVKARSKTSEIILSMYQFPIGMEMFSAGNSDQWTLIKRTIDISDYYLLLIGHRYGSLTEEGISYTEKEYNYACEKGIPIMAFIRNRDVATRPSERESDQIKVSKLNSFIEKAKKSRVCDFWETEEDLASMIPVALMKQFVETPRQGWVRADQSFSDEKQKVDLEQTNLEKQIINYLDDKRREGLVKGTLYGYQLELKLFLEFAKEDTVSVMDTTYIKEFLRFRQDNYAVKSNSSMEKIRAILNSFFEWLVSENLIEKNPVSKVKGYRYDPANNDPLETEEIKEIKGACQTLRERALIETLLSTGCKLNEFVNITLKYIDWSNNTIQLSGMSTRNRPVLLSTEAKKHLQSYLEVRIGNSDYVFLSVKKPYAPLSIRGVQREINEIVARTSITKKVSAKTFRNTFSKNMLEEGYPMNFVQALLGNKEYRNTSETNIKLTNDNIKRTRGLIKGD